jgi:hypothetical protein
MGILTRADKAAGLAELAGGEPQPFVTWHNPETGQEFPRLPADAVNAMTYLTRGLRMGKAPPEARARWEAGAADRAAAAERRVADRFRGPNGAKLRELEERTRNGAGRAAVTPEMVEAAVKKVLMDAGLLPQAAAPQAEEIEQDEETETGVDEAPVQSRLF